MKYKWKDKVRIKGKKELERISEVTEDMLKNGGAIMTIACLVEDADAYIMKEDGDFHFLWTDEMIEGLVEEETLIERVDDNGLPFSEWLSHKGAFHIPDGYVLKDENGNVINATKIVLEKKKKEYPKTYEECAKVLLDRASVRNDLGYKGELLVALQKLLVCRDAYWKLAGEEMGLGKPWEPNWHDDEKKYTIEYYDGEIIKDFSLLENRILSFPTPEMRDAFKENFDPDIEICKELL